MTLRDDILARADLAGLVAARDDGAIAAAMSAGRTKVEAVTRNQFAIWAGTTGMRAKIEDHAANHASPLRNIALLCRDLLQGGPDTLELANPANLAMLAAWVTAGELSQESADALIALATLPDPYTSEQIANALNEA